MDAQTPQRILYAQHGWADDHRAIATLARALADTDMLVVTPNLGFLKTWLRIEPLIQAVEHQLMATITRHPHLPLRIIGHSMGGLIWLEVLDRHPEVWSQVDSLVLVGAPVGGADLARAIDPLEWGIGIARDLGKSRRRIAEAIAAKIPTLVIAGDIDNGSDGTITVQSTKIFGAEFVSLPNIHHAALKNHPAVAVTIQKFWQTLHSAAAQRTGQTQALGHQLIRLLQTVPGMTDAHNRDFHKAQIYLTFADGLTLRHWKNPLGIDHVFVACPQGNCLYGGFVGWLHTQNLRHTLTTLKQEQMVLIA